jgi:hypothetical protein
MHIAFNVPDTVGKSAAPSTCNLLLLKAPLRKLDLVREKNAASHDMHKSELGLDGSEALLRLGPLRVFLDDLDTEEVVCITLETFVSVGGNLVLPVSFSDRGPDVVRMQTAVSGDVIQSDYRAVLDVVRTNIVPGLGACQVRSGVVFGHDWQSLVLHDPDVVLILVRVEGDLLLLASGGVHVAMRVEITTLRVPVTKRDAASERDVGWNILHTLGVQSGLELRRHEAITFARVDKANEVDPEHGHVE